MNSYFANLLFVVNAAQDSSALAGVEGRFTREVLLAGRHGVDSRRNAFMREATLHHLVARHALFSHPCEAQVRARHPLADLDAERARVAAYITAVADLFAALERLGKPGTPAGWLRMEGSDTMESVASAWRTEMATADAKSLAAAMAAR